MEARLTNFKGNGEQVTETWNFLDAGIRFTPINKSEARHERYVKLMESKNGEIIDFPVKAKKENRLVSGIKKILLAFMPMVTFCLIWAGLMVLDYLVFGPMPLP